jgi:Ca2+-binding EF-hand superfamily protein
MKALYNIIATAALLSAASIAHAQAPEGGEKKPEHRKLPPEILAKFDKDGDGKLNEEERAAAKAAGEAKMEERKKEMIAKFDKDGDGTLSDEEKKAAREAAGDRPDPAKMEERKKEVIAKFDKDGDGKLNEEERKAAREAMGGRPGGSKRPGGEKPKGE